MDVFLRSYRPKRRILSDVEIVRICYLAGWKDLESLAEAAATAIPESGGDISCFLAYYDLDQLAVDAYNRRAPITGSLRRAAWFKLRKYIIKQKIRKYDNYAPGSETLHTVDDKPLKCWATDRGLFQISSYWYPKFTDNMSLDPLLNAKFAHQIYVNWDNTFKAWAAHESGYHLKHVARMREVAKEHIYYKTTAAQTASAETLSLAINKDMPGVEMGYPKPANTVPEARRRLGG